MRVLQRIHLWCVARARAPEEEKRNEECKVTTRMLCRKECLNTSDWHGVYTMRMALVVQKILGPCLQQCLFSSPPCLPSFHCKRGSKVQIYNCGEQTCNLSLRTTRMGSPEQRLSRSVTFFFCQTSQSNFKLHREDLWARHPAAGNCACWQSVLVQETTVSIFA